MVEGRPGSRRAEPREVGKRFVVDAVDDAGKAIEVELPHWAWYRDRAEADRYIEAAIAAARSRGIAPRVAVPLLRKHELGYVALVVLSDGAYTWASWIGLFPDVSDIVVWLERMAHEFEEAPLVPIESIGLPTELAVLDDPKRQAERARAALQALRQEGGQEG